MKTVFLASLLTLLLSSCSLWPSRQDDELERLSNDVLNNKKGEGIEIDVKPIEKKQELHGHALQNRSNLLSSMPD